ncbi:MAG: hypothetical protein ACR2PL_17345, partial [Dehalococcoidia bacterium]
MSLLDLLAEDLLAWLERGADGVRRTVLLWLDPASAFARLAAVLEPALGNRDASLLTLANPRSQLPLKLDLLRLEPRHPSPSGGEGPGVRGETGAEDLAEPSAISPQRSAAPRPIPDTRHPIPAPVVVYLPGCSREDLAPRGGAAPALWSVYEYLYKGCAWVLGATWQPGVLPEPPSLLGWLRSRGLKLAETGAVKSLTSGGSDSLLARYALRHGDRAPADWPQPLRLADVKHDLGGEPRDEVRRLLREPEPAVAAWGDEAPIVLERLRETLGIELRPLTDPDRMADETCAVLALAEAWSVAGEAGDFPFLDRLPGTLKQRRALATLLRDEILANEELRAAYRLRIERLEPQYDLWPWAQAHAVLPAGLPHLAKAAWA